MNVLLPRLMQEALGDSFRVTGLSLNGSTLQMTLLQSMHTGMK